jgi:phosphoribosylaminoimidazole carboxylase
MSHHSSLFSLLVLLRTTTLPTLLQAITMDADSPPVVGIIGGGQLGQMLALEAPRLSLSVRSLDAAGPLSPTGKLSASGTVTGGLKDLDKLKELAVGCDVVTMEIEHISVPGLEALEQQGVKVFPSSGTIRIIQDKLVQKDHFKANGIPVPEYMDCPTVEAVVAAAEKLGLPLMLKSRKEGYDGRGNAVLKSLDQAAALFAELSGSGKGGGVYAEGWCPFVDELAVMVVKSTTGEVRAYPTVTAIQRDSVCRVVVAPARCATSSRTLAEDVAMKAIASLGPGACGIFGVELFLLESGAVLLNEIAPRPHNTGHYTQDACAVSQFENHLRAVSGMPLGDTGMVVGAAAMVNVLGHSSGTADGTLEVMNRALSMPRATVHWYGKSGCKPGRKMGHVNVTANSASELDESLMALLDILKLRPEDTSDGGRIPPPEPLVGVIMGSDSDLPCMSAAVEILKKFNIAYECDIVSAHRTPERMMSYAKTAHERGLQCIIAGAGGAAHLPGMVAAMTPLPVIGVPIKTSTLSGVDSLYSICQMPKGIPVATVAIGNAENAGLLAARMLCATRPELMRKMVEYQESLKNVVEGKSEKLVEKGVDAYLEGMANKSGTVNV